MSPAASIRDDAVLCLLCCQYKEPREFPILKGGRLYERCKPCLKRFTPEALYLRDRAICGICLEKVDIRDASVDHVVPVSAWDWNANPLGPHVESNVQLAHLRCNLRKGGTVQGGPAHA